MTGFLEQTVPSPRRGIEDLPFMNMGRYDPTLGLEPAFMVWLHCNHTVDGSEILHQLRLVVYPIIHRVLYIQSGAGFLPSTVWFPLQNLCFFVSPLFYAMTLRQSFEQQKIWTYSGVIKLPILGGIKQYTSIHFQGFPLSQCIVWVGNIMTPGILSLCSN